ncbi:MAG: hypothetical protein AB8B50_15415 [Pirellulaceae bacterium]
MLRRAKVRRTTSEVETLTVNDDAIEFLSEQEYARQLVRKAVDLMKTEFEYSTWRACWLSVVEQVPVKEISDELGITINAVYLAKSRVLRRLRGELEGLLD